MSKYYDKIRAFQEQRKNVNIKQQEAAVKNEFQDGYVRFNIFASQSGRRVIIILSAALLFILWQGWSFNKTIKESQADRIQVFKRLNEQDKAFADSKAKIMVLEDQLKESRSELDIVSQKLKASDARAEVLENQLNEQKATISKLTSVNQELLSQLDSLKK